MKKEFVPYKQALELKELGFGEECFSYYDLNNKPNFFGSDNLMDTHCVQVNRPTYSQTFRWFREKYRLSVLIHDCLDEIVEWTLTEDKIIHEVPNRIETYEEAELACLKKLIEIIEKQK